VSEAAYLALENGRVFEGKFFGTHKETLGELVFSTGMAGYIETLTDNSYYGQIVLQTFPLIGNYGVISQEYESPSVKLNGYIVKSWCEGPSNFRSEGDLDTFLKERGIPGLCGIDTREAVKIIRENGVMNAKITGDKKNIDFDEIKNYTIKNAVKSVSRKEITRLEGVNSKVVLFDFGAKESIKNILLRRGCDLWIVPHDTPAEKIKNINPDGIVFSDGPGDPADNCDIIKNLKEIIDLNIPIFGICLGHQLLGLAHGFKTEKLKFGHRGANHPVKDTATGRVYITNQNHGYGIVKESINKNTAKASFENINDKTCEGTEYIKSPFFSTQFHPDDCESPHGTGFLYAKFNYYMTGGYNQCRLIKV
jgi:carbamoyl-phosphate synthase small subunit